MLTTGDEYGSFQTNLWSTIWLQPLLYGGGGGCLIENLSY